MTLIEKAKRALRIKAKRKLDIKVTPRQPKSEGKRPTSIGVRISITCLECGCAYAECYCASDNPTDNTDDAALTIIVRRK